MHRVILLTRFCKLLTRVAILYGGRGTCLKCLNGTTPLGNGLVSEPGSLTVTRPAGVVVGAEAKLGAVSEEEARLPELGVGQARAGYPEVEAGASELTSMLYSGVERRLDAIV